MWRNGSAKQLTTTVGALNDKTVTASILAGTIAATGYPTARAYTAAFLLCAIALACGVAVGFAIPQRRPDEAFGPHVVGDTA